MKRHGGDLEGQAGNDEHDADDQPGRAVRRVGQRKSELAELHGAGKPVDQRNAVQQQAGGQRAENEIFEPGFRAAQLVAGEGGEHVDRQRLQFEAEIERHHVGGRGHHQHAGGGVEHEHRKLEPAQIGVLVVVERDNHAERGGGQHQQLGEAAETVDGELPVEALPRVAAEDQHGGQQEGADRQHGAEEKTVAFLQHAEQQDAHAADGQHDFRQSERPVHCGRPPANCTAAASAAW